MGCLGSKSAAAKSVALRSADLHHSECNTSNHASKTAVARKERSNANASTLAIAKGSANEITSPRANLQEDQQATLQLFLRSVLDSAEAFLYHLPDSTSLKEVMAISFMNSCTEVARTKIRMKGDLIVNALEQYTVNAKLTLLHSAIAHIQERNMDETFSRILLAWFSNNPEHERRVSSDVCQTILEMLHVRYIATKPAKFEDVLDFYFRWISVNQAALEVYDKFTNSGECMTMEQYGNFLRDTQQIEVSDRQIAESFKYRYGGGIHRYNFVAHNSGMLTNNAVDPLRTSDVWQDMTQSFTRYFVSCARIDCEADVHRALAEGVRALMLNIRQEPPPPPSPVQDSHASPPTLYSGNCSLELVLQTIRQRGFAVNTYPIVLCLSPSTAMSSEVQTSVATMLTDVLGSMLAKGLMFEGGDINDPKFSPGALRKKVLVMGYQSKLLPFIGFLVANMNKDGLGVRVTDVVEGTPAAKSGVLKDDWLTHFNGEPIHNKNHLRQMLDRLKVGDEFTLKRENLDELKVIVGSVVDSNDHSVSSALSDIVFFKYAQAEGGGHIRKDDINDRNSNNKRSGDDGSRSSASSYTGVHPTGLPEADAFGEANRSTMNDTGNTNNNHSNNNGNRQSDSRMNDKHHHHHQHSHHSHSTSGGNKTNHINGAAPAAHAPRRATQEKARKLHASSTDATASLSSPAQPERCRKNTSSDDRVSELRVWDTQRLDMHALLETRLTREMLNTHFVIVSIDTPETKSPSVDSETSTATTQSVDRGTSDGNTKHGNRSSHSENKASVDVEADLDKKAAEPSLASTASATTPAVVDGQNGVSNSHTIDYEGIASRIGVQFIDIANTERLLAWARGRFSDNGRCGYMLKSNLDPERRLDLTISIICGPRALDCLPITHTRVTVCGGGKARTSTNVVVLTGCDESTVAILHIYIMVHGFMHVLTASFSPLLLRAGYRALPCIQATDERSLRKVVHSVYCFIKKT